MWLYPAEIQATILSFGIDLTISSVILGFAEQGCLSIIKTSKWVLGPNSWDAQLDAKDKKKWC